MQIWDTLNFVKYFPAPALAGNLPSLEAFSVAFPGWFLVWKMNNI